MRRASAQIFSIGSHRKKHFSFGFRCGILSLVCRCFLKNSILYTEKLKIRIKYSFFHCRSPHGERGLKFAKQSVVQRPPQSLPTRGAWIEMPLSAVVLRPSASLPTRGAWIEMIWLCLAAIISWSLPTRGAWIEIAVRAGKLISQSVAPHTGSVD